MNAIVFRDDSVVYDVSKKKRYAEDAARQVLFVLELDSEPVWRRCCRPPMNALFQIVDSFPDPFQIHSIPFDVILPSFRVDSIHSSGPPFFLEFRPTILETSRPDPPGNTALQPREPAVSKAELAALMAALPPAGAIRARSPSVPTPTPICATRAASIRQLKSPVL